MNIIGVSSRGRSRSRVRYIHFDYCTELTTNFSLPLVCEQAFFVCVVIASTEKIIFPSFSSGNVQFTRMDFRSNTKVHIFSSISSIHLGILSFLIHFNEFLLYVCGLCGLVYQLPVWSLFRQICYVHVEYQSMHVNDNIDMGLHSGNSFLSISWSNLCLFRIFCVTNEMPDSIHFVHAATRDFIPGIFHSLF